MVGRFKAQYLHHICPPILVIRAIAPQAHGMGRADYRRKLYKIADISLITGWQVLRACARLGMALHWRDRRTQAKHQQGQQANMHRLLIHEGTFARIGADLKQRADKVSAVILHNDGKFRDADGNELAKDVSFTVAYGTPDVWFSPLAQVFVQSCLQVEDLQYFQSSAAGIEHPVLQALREKAGMYASSHAQSEAIAEWVLWAGLDWFQGGPARRAAQAGKRWGRIEFTEIADTHWAIVGFGAIGQATARRLRALGANVTGVRRTPGPHDHADEMIQPDELAGKLPQMDAVLLCCPLTDDTEGMADAAFFMAMKPDALFANVGRGALVDEAAMLSALDADEFGYAALDVVVEEPLPENNPIWGHPKITLTSHLAADTLGSARRTDRFMLSNLDRFLAGEPLKNVVAD